MAYAINNYNGTPVASVVDGTVNNILDIALIGKNYAGYGESLNENFVWLLQNFAGLQAPKKPVAGELWFDAATANLKINVYDGAVWKTLAINNIGESAPTVHTLGDLWYDTVNNQLNVFDGTAYTRIGPESVLGFGPTKMTSIGLQDTAIPSATHAVQLAYSNSNIVYIVNSGAEFTPADVGIVSDFPTIYNGITLSAGVKLHGTSTNTDNLGNNPASYYAPLRDTVFPTLTTFPDEGIAVGSALNILNISSVPTVQSVGNKLVLKTSTGSVSITGADILPSATATSNIGSLTSQFQNIYAGRFIGTSQQADALKVGSQYVVATVTSSANSIVARDSSGGTAVVNLSASVISSGNINSTGNIVASNMTAQNFFGHATSSDTANYANNAGTAQLANVANLVEWTNVANKPLNFVFNDNGLYNINITGNTVSLDGTVMINTNSAAKQIGFSTARIVGNLIGSVSADDNTLIINTLTKQVGYNGANLVGNLTGNSAGTHTGPVVGNVRGSLIGDVLATDSTRIWNSSAKQLGYVGANIVGNLTGPVTGNVTGNLTGNVIGNVTGNITGDVLATDSTRIWNSSAKQLGYVGANIVGSLTGPVTGNVTGDILATDSTRIWNSSAKQLGYVGANIVGSLTGPVTGNLTGNSSGTHTGPVVGNVTGDLTGNSSGTHTGPVVGNVTGNVTGAVTGNVTGNLTGNVYAQGGRIFLGDGSASSPSIAFGSDGAQDTGFYWGGDGFTNIANNGQYSGQFKPGGALTMIGTVTAPTFSGSLSGPSTGQHTGNVTGNVTGNLFGNADTATVINSLGNVTAEANGTAEPANKLTLRSVYNNGYPVPYGNVITVGGAGGGELLVGWSGTTGAHADNYVRSRRDTGNTWSPWAKILTDKNFGDTLAVVASTGSYNDLFNKPSIPTPVNVTNLNANLRKIVQTITGTVDLYMSQGVGGNGSAVGGVGVYGDGAINSWYSYMENNIVKTIAGSSGNSYCYLYVDLATLMGLSNNPSDLNWKGNYDFNIAPSLTRVQDFRNVWYGMGVGTWGVTVAPYTINNQSGDYGKFTISVTVQDSGHYYHGSNVQAGWIAVGVRGTNVYNP
jgi:hypothetical protein